VEKDCDIDCEFGKGRNPLGKLVGN